MSLQSQDIKNNKSKKSTRQHTHNYINLHLENSKYQEKNIKTDINTELDYINQDNYDIYVSIARKIYNQWKQYSQLNNINIIDNININDILNIII